MCCRMLRSIMTTINAPGDREQAFIDMMHDFIESHRDTPASTESFKAIAEKHMTKTDGPATKWAAGLVFPRMGLWHAGAAVQLEIRIAAGRTGQIQDCSVEITQSEVDEHFAMFVPVYADFGNGMVRMGQVAIAGNSTRKMDFLMDQLPKKVAINAYKEILER